MKKIFKFVLLIPCLLMMTSCYAFCYFEYEDYFKNAGKNSGGRTVVHEENSENKDAKYTAFYDEYRTETGIYCEGRENELYYYTQLVFNDGTEAASFVRYEVGYTSTSKVYDVLAYMEHKNVKKGYCKIDEAFGNLYDKTKESIVPRYNDLLLSTINDILDVLETVINPLIKKSMRDWGFNY